MLPLHSHRFSLLLLLVVLAPLVLCAPPKAENGLASRLVQSSINSNRLTAEQKRLTSTLEELLSEQVAQNTSSACVKEYLFLLRNNTALLFRLFDSSGIFPSGVLEGNFQSLGSFPECNELYPLTHYCKLSFSLTSKNKSQEDEEDPIKQISATFGLCLPAQCGEGDLDLVLSVLERLQLSGMFVDRNTTSVVCLPPKPELDRDGIAGIVVLSVMGLVVLLCTAFHYCYPNGGVIVTASSSIPENLALLNETQKSNPTTYSKLFLAVRSFSILYNLPRLLDSGGRGQMTSLNGARVVSICWVILCHTFIWSQADTVDILRAFKSISTFSFQVISNGWSSVDSFFFLSGFLVAFLSIKELKKKGKIPWFLFYFHRIWRLTPVYMFVVFLTITVEPQWLMGPNSVAMNEADSCKKYWWTNLLYINNFYPSSEQGVAACVGVSWYLANDMQMFIVSPLFFFSYYKSKILGWSLIVLGLVANILSSALISNHNNYIGNMIAQMGGNFFEDVYVKPYTRMGAYLMGIAMAFLYHQLLEHHHSSKSSFSINNNNQNDIEREDARVAEIIQHKKENEYAVPVSKYISYGLMLFGGFWMCLIIFGTYTEPTGAEWNVAQNVLYIAFSRIVWSFGLGCVLLMCLTGNGGWVNAVLSHPAFNVLSKLTFGAYLLHPFVLNVLFMDYPGRILYDEFMIITLFLGVACISFGASLVVSLLIEMPIVNLEKLFLPSH
eukprot:TRINITY_DN3341_c0_g1_i1.p1 TRINITY_DN3341_c0_g1~~TRINITY_DN3341_c0_g1_i1.p1  ORF type:complete len:724 (+),score=220.57 TRINITY_DN3341_c0_g1_i1:71-2242(+)